MSKSVFLESHNIKNRAGGLGTFNYELIKAMAKENLDDLQIILNSANTTILSDEFGSKFKSKAELLGGIVLVAMGTKILIEHLFF